MNALCAGVVGSRNAARAAFDACSGITALRVQQGEPTPGFAKAAIKLEAQRGTVRSATEKSSDARAPVASRVNRIDREGGSAARSQTRRASAGRPRCSKAAATRSHVAHEGIDTLILGRRE